MNKIINILKAKRKKIIKVFLGILVGGLIGYAYYYFIGCNSGQCAISSKPLNSIIYWAIAGMLIMLTSSK